MSKRILALGLTGALVWALGCAPPLAFAQAIHPSAEAAGRAAASGAGDSPLPSPQSLTTSTRHEELKKRVVDWGTNKNVSVKLNSGEKVEGRIAEITDGYFSVQLVSQGQVTSREVRYDEVKSLKAKDGKVGKTIGYTALAILAGIGVTVLVVAALAYRD